jgi:hypothetical protein
MMRVPKAARLFIVMSFVMSFAASALSAATTTRFAIVAPDHAQLGAPYNFDVVAIDDNANPTGNYTGTVHFAGNGVAVPADYTFTAGDGGTHTFSATPTRGGNVNYTVSDTVTPSITAFDGIEVSCPGFTVNASNGGPFCPGQAPTLMATSNDAGATFEWQGPKLWQAYGANVNGAVDYVGTYIVIATAPNGCITSAQTAVTKSSEYPQVAYSGTGHSCDGTQQVFSIADAATNGPYSNITWSVTGGTILSGQGTSAVTIRSDYDPNGGPFQQLRVRLSATTGAGCAITDRLVQEFDVYRHSEVAIDTTANACTGSTYTAQAVPVFSKEATPQYQWSITNGTILVSYNSQITYSVTGNGNATLSVTMDDIYCDASASTTITPQGPSATIASANTATCSGETVAIPISLSGTPPFTVTWSDGQVDTGVTSSSYTRTITADTDRSYSITAVHDAYCDGEGTGFFNVTAFDAPTIVHEPAGTTVARGSSARLSIEVAPEAVALQWYRGNPGDRSHPVAGATFTSFETPPVTENTTFWAEVKTNCGLLVSDGAVVQVPSRRQAARHP